ncbi:nucleotidyl transferase AbiEii/AbiGii toxin family protein [Candidatus Woesearchaeota archaeon]|nr:nucleotidyl transferase AbiEii/AbiGii toxin family protein [Candidatus Woesearchaeota archaeon]
MITRKDLEEFARLKRLTLGNAEKDYLIEIALLSISENTKNELVFKGGTCLYKFHKLNRFSEDLDFSAVKKVDARKIVEKVISDFKNFGIKVKLHEKREPHNSVLITLRIEGPLFTGKPQTYAKLGIDINLKSSVIMEPEAITYSSIYPEIAQFNIVCMKPEEIFAEKIRALITRQRARDLFDLNFLLQKGIHADIKLVENKMMYYNEQFDITQLMKKISALSGYWEKELTGFSTNLPKFNAVKIFVEKRLKEFYK